MEREREKKKMTRPKERFSDIFLFVLVFCIIFAFNKIWMVHLCIRVTITCTSVPCDGMHMILPNVMCLLLIPYQQTEHTVELKYGKLIRCKRIYNFWCSMLILHQLLYVLFTLCGIFMHFLELTY
jgi:hypothetical protein